MRKAICPQPIKKVYFYSRQEKIFRRCKILCKKWITSSSFWRNNIFWFSCLKCINKWRHNRIFFPSTDIITYDWSNSSSIISFRNDKFYKDYNCHVNSSSGFRHSTDPTKSSFNSNLFVFNIFHYGSNF